MNRIRDGLNHLRKQLKQLLTISFILTNAMLQFELHYQSSELLLFCSQTTTFNHFKQNSVTSLKLTANERRMMQTTISGHEPQLP